MVESRLLEVRQPLCCPQSSVHLHSLTCVPKVTSSNNNLVSRGNLNGTRVATKAHGYWLYKTGDIFKHGQLKRIMKGHCHILHVAL